MLEPEGHWIGARGDGKLVHETFDGEYIHEAAERA